MNAPKAPHSPQQPPRSCPMCRKQNRQIKYQRLPQIFAREVARLRARVLQSAPYRLLLRFLFATQSPLKQKLIFLLFLTSAL